MGYRLDTVNRCLKAIGEDPVNSLSSGLAEADKASNKIDEVTREVLAIGWHNNIDTISVAPDDDGYIGIPGDYIRVDTANESSVIDVTVRSDPNDDILKLFNLDDQTFVFTDPVIVEIVRYFDIEVLPYHLQNYIAALTARRFQEDEIGSVTVDAGLVRDEQRAWDQLLDSEGDEDDYNALTGSYYMRRVTGRNNPLSGR